MTDAVALRLDGAGITEVRLPSCDGISLELSPRGITTAELYSYVGGYIDVTLDVDNLREDCLALGISVPNIEADFIVFQVPIDKLLKSFLWGFMRGDVVDFGKEDLPIARAHLEALQRITSKLETEVNAASARLASTVTQ